MSFVLLLLKRGILFILTRQWTYLNFLFIVTIEGIAVLVSLGSCFRCHAHARCWNYCVARDYLRLQ